MLLKHTITVLGLLTPALAGRPRRRATLFGLDETRKLTFDAEGKFKVLSLSDMHFGETEADGTQAAWGAEHDTATVGVHTRILASENPNYVVFNGDLITGENIKTGEHGKYLDMCYGPTVERKIPFSSTYGNHDNSDTVDHNTLLGYETSAHPDLSYTRSDAGPAPYGNVNYWVPVYVNDSSTAPAVVMWFLDSRGVPSGADKGKNWADEDAVPAYIKSQAEAMKETWGELPPSVVYMHIPFKATEELVKLGSEGNRDETSFNVQGYLDGTYTGKDVPTLDAIAGLSGEQNKVLAVVTGHVHGQNWCAQSDASKGITQCFDGHSGYGGYVTANSALRNGRVISLDLAQLQTISPTAETWNAYEDGSTGQRVELGPKFMA